MNKAQTLPALLLLLVSWTAAQTVTSFDGIDASQVAKPEYDVDPNGAIGTKQFMEYVNLYYQAYDKVTLAPVWSTPQAVSTPFSKTGLTSCESISGDGMIIFDRLASRWVLAGHTGVENNYLYCVAISNTDDLASPSLAWYTYSIALAPILGKNAEGNVYFPDWPKIATWPDAYYVTIDLNDINQNYREVGIVACALDRTNMLINGTPNSPQCFKETSPLSQGIYLGHSLIPADVDGTTPPPSGRDQYMVSIQNPPIDGSTTTSGTFNLWDFHLNWTNPSLSTFTQSAVSVAPYMPGCYDVKSPVQTVCVPEPSTSSTKNYIDSVGDRFMPRFAYRNFGSYESFLVSHDVQPGSTQQTGIRWYELRASGSGTPTVYQDGTINPDNTTYRFLPSIAEDSTGNAAVGYSISSGQTHPGMNASWWDLANNSAPSEFTIYDGTADQENTWHWGSYDSMTVDPVDGCTFWYVNEYDPQNQTGTEIVWHTRISSFQLPGCGQGSGVTVSPTTLNLGSIGAGSTSPSQPVTLTNNSGSALTIDSISFSGGNAGNFGQTNTCGSNVANGRNCTINVTFTPNANGAFSSALQIADSAGTQTVGVSGAGVTAVTLSASSIAFGTVFIGSSSTAPSTTLTNNQSVALTNISISVNSSSYTQENTCGTSIGAGAKCTITVTFSPKSAGTLTGTVTISDSGSNSPQTISLKGSGKQPVNLAPATLSFGAITVGTTSGQKNETLTNEQKVALTFSNIAITGNDPGDFKIVGNTCGSGIGAQTECIVSIEFVPTAKGARTATLQFTDSAGTSPQTVNLTGTGQ